MSPRSFLASFLVAGICIGAAFAATGRTTIYTAAAANGVDTTALPNLLDNPPPAFDPQKHYLLQFDSPMTPQRRAALAAAGVVLGDYFPENAYTVDLAAATPAAIQALPEAVWLGEFPAEWKLQPGIGDRPYFTPERLEIAAAGDVVVDITLFEGADEQGALDEVMAVADTLYRTEIAAGNTTFVVRLPLADVPLLAQINDVQFVEETPDVTMRNQSTRWIIQTNTLNSTPVYDAGIHGENQVVGVMDGKIDQNHCSFAGKIIAYNTSPGADFHGTHVGATAVGDAGADNNTRGIAYGGQLVFDDIPSFTDSAMYNALLQHHNQGARAHTNSWGDDGTTAYNGLCRGIDRFSYDFEDSLVLFAVTNLSTLKNPDNAKNLLAVGASQDTPNTMNHCSGGTGPTSDGRRKPEIYAPGCSTQSAAAGTACSTTSLTGTSMACPAVAGAALLARQYYTDGYYPSGAANPADAFVPSGALVKATLLNSAVDMTGISGYPSNQEGWGITRLNQTLNFVGQGRATFVADVRNADGMSTGETIDYPIEIVDSAPKLKVTLVWTDPPASAGASNAWINDLDLQVIAPDASVYLGNVFSGGESTTGGAADNKNNVEQVHISNPQTGPWILRVNATAVNQGTQGFALVASGGLLPDSPALQISLPNGAPSLVPPSTPVDFDVLITPGDETVASANLLYSIDGGAFASAPLTFVGGDLYTATLPGITCAESLDYYIEATGDLGTVVTSPGNAPAGAYSAIAGTLTVITDDPMEADAGWTVGAPGDTATTGIWNRMDPEATAAQPEDDHTADPGTDCWVTDGFAGASLGANDVDGGATTLVSPVYDLSGVADATVSYWRWYSNDQGAAPNADVFRVDITADGVNWVNAETVGPSGPDTSGGWIYHEFLVSDFVTPSATVQLRFIAEDAGSGSIVEAAIDDLRIDSFDCTDVPNPCAGDVDGDNDVDLTDLALLLSDFDCTGGCVGDVDGDGDTDLSDLAVLLANFGVPCP
ncbi:MAG: hypothetical protein D6744_01040 [Planctomycetota bacterium]|nr:MAG: hypothetical protein D6744_01040 [Planctomycetota bacterium]